MKIINKKKFKNIKKNCIFFLICPCPDDICFCYNKTVITKGQTKNSGRTKKYKLKKKCKIEKKNTKLKKI